MKKRRFVGYQQLIECTDSDYLPAGLSGELTMKTEKPHGMRSDTGDSARIEEATSVNKINLTGTFEKISKHGDPKIIGELNGQHVNWLSSKDHSSGIITSMKMNSFLLSAAALRCIFVINQRY